MSKSRMWPNWTPTSTSSTGQSLITLDDCMAPSLLPPAEIHDGGRLECFAGTDQTFRPHKRHFRRVQRFAVVQPVVDAPGQDRARLRVRLPTARVDAEADHVLVQPLVKAELDLEFHEVLEQVGEVGEDENVV